MSSEPKSMNPTNNQDINLNQQQQVNNTELSHQVNNIDLNYHDSSSLDNREDTVCSEETQPSIGFTSALLGVINNQDLEDISDIQTDVSTNLNSMITKCQNFNEFSQNKYTELFKKFEQHTQVTKELQQDLENVFKRIRALKTKVESQYPTHFEAVKRNLPDITVEDD